MTIVHRLTIIAGLALVAAACQRPRRNDPAELVLAAAASESLTVALADSIAPTQGFIARQAGAGVESLSACSDQVDSRGWQSVASLILEMQLPAGYAGSNQTGQIATWSGPGGSIRVSAHSTDPHSGWTGLITSECEVFVSGSPTHVDLVTTSYGLGVHALIKVRDAPAIGVEAQARSIEGQADLLHAIRNARVSAAWGRQE